MSKNSIERLLLVEDSLGDARLLREMLNEQNSHKTNVTHVQRMSEAEKYVAEHDVDLILLDLGLPDSQGLGAVRRAHAAAPRVPLVVLTGLDDEALAAQALQEGAQDYLIKGQIETLGLLRALRYAVERKMMERERDELEAQFHRSQKLEALGTLAGGIAHDLNNALTPVICLTGVVLQEAAEGSRHLEALRLIDEGGKRARDLVRRILTFARKDEPKRAQLDLAAVARSALKLLRASIPATIAISEQIMPVRPILADEGQLHQVLTNLVTNAAQAIGNRMGTITVEVLEVDDAPLPTGGAAVRLTVMDTGCGMDEATRQRMFDPFFTTKSVGVGTGLGLSVVHGIVAAHGGAITVESEFGRGSRFDIYLLVASAVPAVLNGAAA